MWEAKILLGYTVCIWPCYMKAVHLYLLRSSSSIYWQRDFEWWVENDLKGRDRGQLREQTQHCPGLILDVQIFVSESVLLNKQQALLNARAWSLVCIFTNSVTLDSTIYQLLVFVWVQCIGPEDKSWDHDLWQNSYFFACFSSNTSQSKVVTQPSVEHWTPSDRVT
jgi:hypothetical protein